MGNNSTTLSDEPGGDSFMNQREIRHFDHTFKGEIHTTSGGYFTNVFGECKFAKREIQLNCKATSFELVEEIGLKSKKQLDVSYQQVSTISWDHNSSEVKLELKSDDGSQDSSFVILTMANTIELEGELKLRLAGAGMRVPTVMYMGMFAGETKPKPFQRKRPNLSRLPPGKLPQLHDMREKALALHRGSYKPCAQGVSRRIDLAVQHIHEGFNTLGVVRVRGVPGIANQWRPESVVQLKEDALLFKPFGPNSPNTVDFKYEDIADWRVEDNENIRPSDSGIELELASGGSIMFIFPYVREAKHTLEYFWNNHCLSTGRPVKLGTTHGRPLVTVTTLSGEVPAPESPQGQSEVVDQDGVAVRPGNKMLPRGGRSMLGGGGKEAKVVPPENRGVRGHWPKVVMHQGWLLKKGGIGVAGKSWIKRYFVLYRTSQGHFLVYYADFTECPLFSSERGYRNVVDLAKCTFIRPGSIRANAADTPPNSFDIVTIEREWTLCAETQDNAQRWLKLLTRAVDEDVAILPDEELLFKVKPKVDPLHLMPASDYSTSLRISAHGISVGVPDTTSGRSSSLSGPPERELFFWVYTDFYKWSLLSQNGKLALLVNVFADSSFGRRNEFIFRNKEAQRLATSIEFFIEKFMCVMHIRLETEEGAFDEVAGSPSEATSPIMSPTRMLSHMSGDADEERHADEVDDLLLDLGSLSVQPPVAGLTGLSQGLAPPSSDPFSGSPFGEDDDDHEYHSSANAGANLLDEDDLLGVPVATHSNASTGVGDLDAHGGSNYSNDLFGNDDAFVRNAPVVLNPTPSTALRQAPPLTTAQLAQHTLWHRALLAKQSGSFYDDGALQIALLTEVRGSQGRITFYFRNQSPATLSDLQLVVEDQVGLTRFELGAGPTTIPALSSATSLQQQLMLECMKPVTAGPTVVVSYVDSLLGRRTSILPLPVVVTTFNDPLTLVGSDFTQRWESLTAPGLQAQEVFYPSVRVVPAEITGGLNSGLRFGLVTGVPGESEYIIHGAASLRTGTLTPAGDKISIGCLAKVEMNVQTNAIRVTVRTLHPAATAAIMATAKTLLG